MRALAAILLFCCSPTLALNDATEETPVEPTPIEEARGLAEELEGTSHPYEVGSESSPVPHRLGPMIERVETYLELHPDEVDALIVAARLERLASRPAELVAVPDLSRPHHLLDRALDLQPESAAAHYWKSRLFGEQVLASDKRLRFAAIDLEAAINYGSRAVDFDPENLLYRETLALLLAENLQLTEAMAVLDALDQTEHPIYLLLQDQTTLATPTGAVRSPLSSEEMQMIHDRYLIDRYEQLRSWAWIFEGPASGVEEFYATSWPDFQLFLLNDLDMGSGVSSRSYRQHLLPGEDSWTAVESREQLPGPEGAQFAGVTLRVEEMVAFPRPLLATIVPEELLRGKPGRTFTMLMFINNRFFPEALPSSRNSTPPEQEHPHREPGEPGPDQ